MQSLLRPVELDPTLRPRLGQGEAELMLCSNVSISWVEGARTLEYKGCDLVLTSLRLIFIRSSQVSVSVGKSPPAFGLDLSLFSGHRKVSGLKSWFSSPKIMVHLRTEPQRQQPKELCLSFDSGQASERNGFSDRMLTAQENLARMREAAVQKERAEEEDRRVASSAAGIKRILRRQEARQQRAEQTLTDAFADLNSLMTNAQEVVRLAETYGDVLARDSENSQGEASEKFNCVLHELGMVSPVTKETAGTAYHTQLSRQLAGFMLDYWDKQASRDTAIRLQPLSILTDVYCMYNRARGTDLISPDDLLVACKLFPKLNLPLHLKEFPESGVLALEGQTFSESELAASVLRLMESRAGISALELSELTGTSLILCGELLVTLERSLHICRDAFSDGSQIRFYPNLFLA